MQLHINLVLEADVPSELLEAVTNGDDVKLRAWALNEITDLLDGESKTEFGAQLLGVSVRG